MSRGNPVHRGKRSWWDGSVTTLCGITWTKQEAAVRRAWLASVDCPSCKAAMARGKR